LEITEQFTRQHHEIISLCDQLFECAIEKHIGKDASFVHKIQQSLYKVLNLHHRLEDHAFYPMLHEHQDPRVREASLRLKEKFLNCGNTHQLYQETYPTPQSIESDPAQYVRDTQTIINMIRNRINSEERELYSLLR
jgi:hypothetical protein